MAVQASLKCKKCRRDCKPVPCQTNPEASEFYCDRCHESYTMDAETAEAFLEWEDQKHQARGRKG